MQAVCLAVEGSTKSKQDDIDINLVGCESETIPRYKECFVATEGRDDSASSSESPDEAMDQLGIVSECRQVVLDSLSVERAIIKMSVAYDAGYRSMLQFAGMMDWMMEDLPTKMVRPVRDMVNMLGKLHEIPCFIGQCDEPDTSSLK